MIFTGEEILKVPLGQQLIDELIEFFISQSEIIYVIDYHNNDLLIAIRLVTIW